MEEVIARPRTAAGIEQICERKPEPEVDGTLQLRIEDAEGRRVELKDGECNGDGGDHLLRQSRIVGGVGFAVVFLENCFGSFLIGHREFTSFEESVYIFRKNRTKER